MIEDSSGSAVSTVHQNPVTRSQRITEVNGTLTSTIDLDPWGGETGRSSNQAFQPHRFTSYERDANGGDDAMHRRYGNYWARFSQPDPYDGSYSLADPQSLNRYAYTQNDPVNFVDPSGLNLEDPYDTRITTDTWGRYDPWSNPLFWRYMFWTPDIGTGGPTGSDFPGTEPQNPVTVTVSAQIPLLQPVNCPGGGVTAVSASGRGNTVIISYSDATQEVRQGGSRAWRNNNPGNIRPGNLQGEIGSAGRFAVFSSEPAGQSAIVQLLSRPAYQALTVYGAIARWAPPTENNTASYQATVQNLTGINGQTPMSTLTQGQLQSVANAIRNIEGWRPGGVTCWRQ